MTRSCLTVLAVLLLLVPAAAQEERLPKWVVASGQAWKPPPQGVVRDARAAISIARAVWLSTNPDTADVIASEESWQRNVTATLSDGVWQVTEPMKPSEIGGTFFIFIAKKDGRVLEMLLTQ
jgi:hypothetical protein